MRTFGGSTFGENSDHERALLRGVLILAERDLHSKDAMHREDAKRWFRSDDESHIFMFIPVCDYLGLKPNYIRKRLGLM